MKFLSLDKVYKDFHVRGKMFRIETILVRVVVQKHVNAKTDFAGIILSLLIKHVNVRNHVLIRKTNCCIKLGGG